MSEWKLGDPDPTAGNLEAAWHVTCCQPVVDDNGKPPWDCWMEQEVTGVYDEKAAERELRSQDWEFRDECGWTCPACMRKIEAEGLDLEEWNEYQDLEEDGDDG